MNMMVVPTWLQGSVRRIAPQGSKGGAHIYKIALGYIAVSVSAEGVGLMYGSGHTAKDAWDSLQARRAEAVHRLIAERDAARGAQMLRRRDDKPLSQGKVQDPFLAAPSLLQEERRVFLVEQEEPSGQVRTG